MSAVLSHNSTINNLEEDIIPSNNTDHSSIAWVLKLVIIQLALCCFLTACYIGIRIRIQKLNKNKKQIGDEIANEKLKTTDTQHQNTNVEMDVLNLDNRNRGISAFAMPQNNNSKHSKHLNTVDLTDSEPDLDTETNKNTNNNSRYTIKQLMNKMMKPITKNSTSGNINESDTYKKTEIEMSAYNYDYKHGIDGQLSIKSTYAKTAVFASANRARIDTDNTFPSIPNDMSYDIETENIDGIATHNEYNNNLSLNDKGKIINALPATYNFYNVGTPESSLYNKFKKNSCVETVETVDENKAE